jgi:NADH dehydrogenase FAD-containing subunit
MKRKIVIVGGGFGGLTAEIAKTSIIKDFRNIKPNDTKSNSY